MKEKILSKNVTLKQIAAELGLSAMTVSRALNNHDNVDEKTKERVKQKAKVMGYTPNNIAKSLVSQRTYTIGVVIPEISHTFFAQVVSGIENVTQNMRYQLLLTNSAEDSKREEKALQTLLAQQVDGILISCTMQSKDYSFYKNIIDSGKPFVFFDRYIEGLGASTVRVDDKKASKKMSHHMISHGYDKIAYLSGPEISIGEKRLNGFLEAMDEGNIPVDEDLIINSGFKEDGGYDAMQQIFQLPQVKWPRAVVAVNDPVAIGAMDAIKTKGLSVPEDIAVCGFSDDIRAGLLKCPLTTVYQPTVDIGKKAAEKLIKIIENKEEPIENIDLLTKLVIRGSCGCEYDD